MPDQRTLGRWTRKALSLPPRETARLVARKLRHLSGSMAERRRDMLRTTYGPELPAGPMLARYVERLPVEVLAGRRRQVAALTQLYLDHRFDLLGSGWVQVALGVQAAGVEGSRYPPSAPPTDGDVVGSAVRRLNHANRTEARRIRALVDADHVPIDWQLDFKSGYRWSEATWYRDIRYGDERGADVKVPWELGRCQHLPQLALGAILAASDDDRAHADRLACEFRDQVLDFVAANPPRYGVQWVTSMDVAIRVANWLLAWDLFASVGVHFDEPFRGVFTRSIAEHAHHIASNLEWSEGLRANHYLADVVGLLFAAAYLPSSPRVDAWLLFATRELLAELRLQFHGDGGSFEGSTCYHRLSTEMATYGTALLLSLPEPRLAAVFEPPATILAAGRAFPGAPLAGLAAHDVGDHRLSPVSLEHLELIGRAGALTRDITKPSGRVPQFGDNDSGRFFRLAPDLEGLSAADAVRRYRNLDGVVDADATTPYLHEEHLAHGHLIDAVDGLLGRHSRRGRAGYAIDGVIVNRLASPEPGWAALGPSRVATARIGNQHDLLAFEDRLLALPPPNRRELGIDIGGPAGDVRLLAYPDFGIYLAKSPRIYLAIRCGPRGQNGYGGHDHNDQLGIELSVDGDDWIRDPGTYLYTPIPEIRDAYRSVRAHFAPQLEDPEPASLEEGPFILGPGNEARCIYWGDEGFAGESRWAGGRTALCRVQLLERSIRIVHGAEGAPLVAITDRAMDDWRSQLPAIPYSPGYGIVER